MNKHFEQLPRFSFSAVGIATGSILVLIVAMAVSLIVDVPPSQAKTATNVARATTTARA